MGAYKTLDIELQELDAEVDFNKRDDVFDLVIDSKLSNVKLSPLMLKVIVSHINEYPHLQPLMWLPEFVEAMDWHYYSVVGGK